MASRPGGLNQLWHSVPLRRGEGGKGERQMGCGPSVERTPGHAHIGPVRTARDDPHGVVAEDTSLATSQSKSDAVKPWLSVAQSLMRNSARRSRPRMRFCSSRSATHSSMSCSGIQASSSALKQSRPRTGLTLVAELTNARAYRRRCRDNRPLC